jgi:tRNA (pseudouridine54-N1)-methyltransferase
LIRHYIIISNTVDTTKTLSLNSLTNFGRIDVLCRCIASAFFLSNSFRKNIRLSIFFTLNNSILQIDGSTVRGINPDERAIAGVLKRVFKGSDVPGIRFFEGKLEELVSKYQPAMLDRHGEIYKSEFPHYESFIIGDQLGYPQEYEKLFTKLKKISLGINEYLSSQTITILNYLLDGSSDP